MPCLPDALADTDVEMSAGGTDMKTPAKEKLKAISSEQFGRPKQYTSELDCFCGVAHCCFLDSRMGKLTSWISESEGGFF
jgi:hypothetical protein